MVMHKNLKNPASSFFLLLLAFSVLLGAALQPLENVLATTADSLTPSGQVSVIDLTGEVPADEIHKAQELASILGKKYKQDVVLEISDFGGDEVRMDNEMNRLVDSGNYGFGPAKVGTLLLLDNMNYLRVLAFGGIDLDQALEHKSPPDEAESFAIIEDVNANFNYLKESELLRQILYSFDYVMAQRSGSAVEANPFLPPEALALQTETLESRRAALNDNAADTTPATASDSTAAPSDAVPETTAAIETSTTLAPKDLLPTGNNTSAAIAATPSGGPTLLDPENLLTPKLQESLSNKALEVGQKFGLDVVLAIMTTETGQSAMANADDLFDYGNYGPDGILGLVDVANRTVWISTTGTAKDLLSNDTLDRIAEKVVENNNMGNAEYAGAMTSLMAGIEDKLLDTRPRLKALDIGIAAGVALLVFLIFFGITNTAYRQPKGAARLINLKTQAIANYEDIQDNLIDSHVTQSVINRSSSGGGGGGGGGGFHTGSSGSSHGGGGASW